MKNRITSVTNYAVKSLGDLLFDTKFGECAEPLFPTQRALARAICSLEGSKYNNAQTLAVFLNQIILNRRPCPDDLRQYIATIAENRAKQMGIDPNIVIELLGESFVEKSEISRVPELLRRQVQARVVVVVNPFTVENSDHPRKEDFQKALVKGVLSGKTKYTFAMNDEAYAKGFWTETLRSFITNTDGDETKAREKLEQINRNNMLSVLMIDSGHCVVPTVSYDPQRPMENDTYVWSIDFDRSLKTYHDEIAKMSDATQQKWVRHVYSEIVLGKNKPYTFRDTNI